MAIAGELAVALTGDLRGLKASFSEAKQETKSLQQSFKSTGKRVGNLGRNMTKLVTGPMAAVGAGLLENARRTGNYADEILDLESATGMSTQSLQEWRAVADRAGTSTDAVANAQQKLVRQMGRGKDGSASLKRGLSELGLSMDQLKDASPDEQMNILMERLRGIEDEGKRARVGNQVLKGSYEELAPILGMSSEKMKEVTEQANESGRVMDQEALEAANQFREGLEDLKTEFKALFRDIATDFMPVLNEELIPALKENLVPLTRTLSDRVGELVEWFANLSPPVQKSIIGFTAFLGLLGPILAALGPIISAIGTLISLISGLGAALGATQAPLLAGIAAISALGLVIFEVVRNWESASGMFVGAIKYIIDWAKLMGIRLKMIFYSLPGIVLYAVDAIMNKLELLENVPFIGDKFAGLGDIVSSASNSMQEKIEKLGETAEDQKENMKDSFGGMVESAKEFGTNVVDDAKNVVSGFKDMVTGTEDSLEEQSETTENEQEKQTEKTKKENQKRVENTKENEKKRTEIVKEESQKRSELREEEAKKEDNDIRIIMQKDGTPLITNANKYQQPQTQESDTKAEETSSQEKEAFKWAKKLMNKFNDLLKSIDNKMKKLTNKFQSYAKDSLSTLNSIDKISKNQIDVLNSIDQKMNTLDSILTALNNLDVNIVNKYYNNNQQSGGQSSNLNGKLQDRGVGGSYR